MDINAQAGIQGFTDAELKTLLHGLFAQKAAKRVLIIPPDITRFYSKAGIITNICYHYYTDLGAEVDILPALGTHFAMTEHEAETMFGDVPFEKFLVHNWRTNVEKLGEVPAEYVSSITEGLWNEGVDVEVSRYITEGNYDYIFSVGQVVPHEVIGMANHSKNIFVGVGGADMINKSHIVGAVYGMERMMGRDNTPVRKIFDYAIKHYLNPYKICYILTVTTAEGDNAKLHGVFAGEERDALEAAIALSQKTNIDFVQTGIKKCVVYLDPKEFRSTWLGNKAVYRTRMAIADGGELIVLAPGVEHFGEDKAVDALIRKYGYCGRTEVLKLISSTNNEDLKQNLGAAAHLIHGSSDGRFKITYAVDKISREEIENVCYNSANYEELARKYDINKLKYGYNTMDDGEEIYFIPNPALGLWINRERFEEVDE